jgi:hypothetical protein
MSNLTKAQKKKIADALERGVKDGIIADALKLEMSQVASYREALGLSRAEITGRRYAYWKKMLNSGSTLVEIAGLYGVKPNSVKLMLWHTERFSLVEAKKESAKALSDRLKSTRKSANFDW